MSRLYTHECEDCEQEFSTEDSCTWICPTCIEHHVFCFMCEEDITEDEKFTDDCWDATVCEGCYWDLEETRCCQCQEYEENCQCCDECGDEYCCNDECDVCCKNELGKKEW